MSIGREWPAAAELLLSTADDEKRPLFDKLTFNLETVSQRRMMFLIRMC